MAVIELTPGGFREGMALDPGWYKANLKLYKTALNKNKDALNYIFTFDVMDPKIGETREITTWISPKMRGWQLPFGRLVSALEGKPFDPNAALAVDEEELKKFASAKTELYVHTTPSPMADGKLSDSLDDYLPGDTEDPNQVPF